MNFGVYGGDVHIPHKNTDGLVNKLTSNLVILNQDNRVPCVIGQEKILKQLGELDKEKYIPI